MINKTKNSSYTVFLRIDAAAFIYFVGQFGAATIRGRRIFEGGVYSRAAFILLGNMNRAAYTGIAHSTTPKFCHQAGKTFEQVWLLQKPVKK